MTLRRDSPKSRAWAEKRGGLKRKKPIAKVNRKRAASKFARNFHSRERVRFVNRKACAFCGGAKGIRNHHVDARGMGGAGGDWTKILPCCAYCDRIWEDVGANALLAMRRMTWDDVDWALAELNREWAEYERRSVAA